MPRPKGSRSSILFGVEPWQERSRHAANDDDPRSSIEYFAVAAPHQAAAPAGSGSNKRTHAATKVQGDESAWITKGLEAKERQSAKDG